MKATIIDRYIAESKRDIGRTKTQVLRTIKTFDIAEMKCSEITSADIVSFAQSLKVAPQTVSNSICRTLLRSSLWRGQRGDTRSSSR